MNPLQTYERSIAQVETAITQLKAKNQRIFLARIALGLGIFVLGYFALYKGHWGLSVAFSLDLIGFLWLVRKHINLKDKLKYSETLLAHYKNEVGYLKNDLTPFETGAEFHDHQHPYALDLDILGEQSLFQRINRSVTLLGKQSVANELLNTTADAQNIEEKRSLYQALSQQIDWCMEFRALGSLYEEKPEDNLKLKRFLEEKGHKTSPLLSFLLIVLPAITLVTIIAAAIGLITWPLLIIPVVINWLVVASYTKQINYTHSQLGDRVNMLSKYKSLLKKALTLEENEAFKSIKTAARGFLKPTEQLEKFLELFDYRLNFIFLILGNSLVLFDLQIYTRLLKWKENHQSDFLKIISFCAHLDQQQSMAGFLFNHPTFCVPTLENKKQPFLETEGATHPFLDPNSAVRNDFSLGSASGKKYAILTGANMAGKSTFLRTIGINWVLAQSGLHVCASKWTSSCVEILTSMRLSDSLKDDASYFKAEVLRLKFIVDKLEEGTPALVLLDEILRGTNSDDKRKGTFGIMQQMADYNAIGLLATHDLELAELQEKSDLYTAFCFESAIENDKLTFDYQLHHGIAQSKNASEILRLMGVLKS